MAVLAGSVAEAAARLTAGGLVALPTETVYGLAADATDNDAVGLLRRTKGRPDETPLPVCLSGVEAAHAVAVWNEAGLRLASAYWPGPVSIVLPARPGVLAPDVAPGMGTVALRCPDHELTLSVLRAVGRPLVMPSANPSGSVAPTDASTVLAAFGASDLLVLDGGPTRAGIESTIIRCVGAVPEVLRLGALDGSSIAATLGLAESGLVRNTDPASSRNATRATLVVSESDRLEPGDVLITHERDRVVPVGVTRHVLPSDAPGYASGLYAAMRAADLPSTRRIVVQPVPADPAFDTVRDRLERAASASGRGSDARA